MSKQSDDLSIAERGVVANNHGRPISWVVVGLVCGGFILAGVAMTIPTPWLAYVGLGIVVFGGILGAITHAMAHGTMHVDTPAQRANPAPGSSGRVPADNTSDRAAETAGA